ncbi:MAG: ABC transporter permease [Chloroflexota bacterium]|nr:ABC transporter permease [Chloroflexota bacterium]
MNSLQEVPSGYPAATTRSQSVVLGRQDYFSVVFRLIGMELYKIRRRAMSKVLGILSIVAVLATFTLFAIIISIMLSSPASSFTPSSCSDTGQGVKCTKPQLTPAQEEQFKQNAIENNSQPLRLPTSLSLAVGVIQRLGMILIIILVGSIVGGEYGIGTVRLLFTRGPTRTQFLLAKIGVALFCIAVSLLVLTLFGILLGLAFNPLSGVVQNFTFFSAAWLAHTLLFLLVAILGLFMYAMMALFLGTLGRTTAAGVAGALAWGLIEPVIGTILSGIGNAIGGRTGDILKGIPDYFIGNNIDVLIQNQSQYVFGGAAASLSDVHALLVLGSYLVVFIGLSWLVTVRRDVTN